MFTVESPVAYLLPYRNQGNPMGYSCVPMRSHCEAANFIGNHGNTWILMVLPHITMELPWIPLNIFVSYRNRSISKSWGCAYTKSDQQL